MKITVEYNLSDIDLEAINGRVGLEGQSTEEFAKTWLWVWGAKALDRKVDEYLKKKYEERR